MTLPLRTLLYLRRQLARSPAEDPQEIVDARWTFEQSVPGDEAESALDARLVLSHGELEWELSRIRSDFWLDGVETIQQRLDRLDTSGHPDMKVAVERLRNVAGLRGRLDQLQQRRGCDPQFLTVFRGVLIEPAQQAAVIRGHVYEALKDPKRRGQCQRTVKEILAHFPEVAELEQSWLQEISELTAEDLMIASQSDNQSAALGCAMIVTVPIACYLAYRLVVALI